VHPLLDLVGYNLGVAVVPASFGLKRPDQLTAVALSGDVPEWTVAVAVSDEPSPAAAAFLRQLARVEAPGSVEAVVQTRQGAPAFADAPEAAAEDSAALPA
jgi:hypothetical protein